MQIHFLSMAFNESVAILLEWTSVFVAGWSFNSDPPLPFETQQKVWENSGRATTSPVAGRSSVFDHEPQQRSCD
jgi:hypothetical protein